MSVDPGALEGLRAAIRGEVVAPGDAAYDEARAVWNGMIDRRPALVARCAETADVVAAVNFARDQGLVVAVRGGAHNVAGNATCDDGLVIDLSPMKRVVVDGDARTARAGGGLTWGDFDRATQAAGLATTGGLVSTTGIAGFTLGGGVGWLMRRHGLACDNMIGAEVVCADGRVIEASGDPELLWGLRGGGGNFGVVTEFEFALHPVSTVLGGLVAWPLERARDVLRFWRSWTASPPEELCTLAAILYGPPEPFIPPELHGAPIIAIACFHTDPEGSAQADVAPLRELEPPVDVLSPMPYTVVQSLFDASAPPGLRSYWRSSYMNEISDEAIDVLLGHAGSLPFPMGAVHIHQLGGEMARVGETDTAYGNRSASFLTNFLGVWPDPAQDSDNIAWVRAISDAMAPHGTGARYVNFLAEEGEAGVRSSYDADTFARLQKLKARYDPENFFHLNQNIPPS
ncbi:MAG TPA: FAD-binding oxidoreductase [Solirubrobacteraceae bacterium]|jgi:FAD/FMN-containing dehydrogenase